jgi:putative endonuclease
MTKFFAYVLKSEIDCRLYKGVTSDLKRRLNEHNSGYNKSTKRYIPWTLVYFEEFNTFAEARKRELYFKSGSGREFIKTKIGPVA